MEGEATGERRGVRNGRMILRIYECTTCILAGKSEEGDEI